MKKNQDKLNDALGMVDEEIVQSAMTHAESMRTAHLSRRTVIRRRFAILAAATLALTLMVGAIFAVPLLMADDPNQTEPPVTVTTEEDEPFYVEAPLVRISRLSATETADITDSAVPTEILSTQVVNQNDFFNNYTFLTIDCEPGETVTLTADTDCMLVIDKTYETVLAMDGMLDYELELWRCNHRREHPTYYSTQNGPVEYTYFEKTATFDPAASCIYVALRYGETEVDQAVISFTIQNAEGQTTGAGSVCVGRRNLISVEERTTYTVGRYMTVTRATVLGSVRFTDHTAVTEEQVTELIDRFEAGAEDAFDAMDYTPTTAYEERMAIYADICSMVLAEEGDITGGHCGMDGGDDYSFFGTHHENGRDREFVIFGDGTWTEINEFDTDENCYLYKCHADPNCPMTAEKGLHHPLWPGCHMVAKDGRVYELVDGDWENGILGTTKLIYVPNA